MGITVNGLIAKTDGDSQWTSEEDLKGFRERSSEAGNCIMGKNTFLETVKYGHFPFPGALNVVLTKEPVENKWGESALFLDKSPEEVLKVIEERGFDTAFVIGGGALNSAFMKEGLIDEIYLDVEPLVFAKGIPVFREADFEYWLELIEVKKLNHDTIQLHYRVKK